MWVKSPLVGGLGGVSPRFSISPSPQVRSFSDVVGGVTVMTAEPECDKRQNTTYRERPSEDTKPVGCRRRTLSPLYQSAADC
jgi:hypothetical protein